MSRRYLQPQWVFDSANFRVLAQAELYGVGKVPPAHLSPFVQQEEEGYVPDYLQSMLKLQVGPLYASASYSCTSWLCPDG